jgi:E3 ubiquitin-protein ligase CBL
MVRKQDKPLPAPPPPLRDPPPPPERPPPIPPDNRLSRHFHHGESVPSRDQPMPLEAWCPRDAFGTNQVMGCRILGDGSPKPGVTANSSLNGRHSRMGSEQVLMRKHRRHDLPSEGAKVRKCAIQKLEKQPSSFPWEAFCWGWDTGQCLGRLFVPGWHSTSSVLFN